MTATREPDPCVVVIFGASGDLTSRKLVPALFERDRAGQLPPETRILGVSRTPMSDDQWRQRLEASIRSQGKNVDAAQWSSFVRRLSYFTGSGTSSEAYPRLSQQIESLARPFRGRANVLFDLAVAPSLYEPIIARIDEAGLVLEGRRWCSLDRDAMPWQRIIVEKPFGHDIETAASLNRALGRVFEEDRIYRIDHYLGKEIVQNLLVFRFANTIFEPLWNHRYIDHVQITAAETVGVGARADYYDEAGAIRDMIQSHLLQVLALVAMEPPTSFRAHDIRREKIKIIDAIEPTTTAELSHSAALGQYAGDERETAYHLADGVRERSTTETFAAVRLHFDNWRWSGTPFYLRTGKRMATKRTEIVVQFKQPPANLFRHLDEAAVARPPNRIVIEIAPGGGVSLRFEGKVPGAGMRLDSVTMDFDYVKRFEAEPVEAYGPLIIDAMRGDQTMYPHRYEVEGAWRAVMPFIGSESAPLRAGLAANYAPGSWGPSSADALMARDGRAWHNAASAAPAPHASRQPVSAP